MFFNTIHSGDGGINVWKVCFCECRSTELAICGKSLGVPGVKISGGGDRAPLFGGHRFGQIAGTIDVAAAHHSDVVGQQLHRNDGQNSLQKKGLCK